MNERLASYANDILTWKNPQASWGFVVGTGVVCLAVNAFLCSFKNPLSALCVACAVVLVCVQLPVASLASVAALAVLSRVPAPRSTPRESAETFQNLKDLRDCFLQWWRRQPRPLSNFCACVALAFLSWAISRVPLMGALWISLSFCVLTVGSIHHRLPERIFRSAGFKIKPD